MISVAQSVAAAVNHLLAREPWAREELLRYRGRTARLAAQPLVLALTVGDDGLVAPAQPQATADVVLSMLPDAAKAWFGKGAAAAMRHVRIEGDAEFAAAIGKLVERLRWEPEEDLARLVGDAPAFRIAETARAATAQARRTGRNLLDSAVEYVTEERPQLMRRAALDAFAAELARARDSLARLEKRVERSEQSLRSAPDRRDAGAAPRSRA
jgi:ubiquinone biosynthesis protein UbiJ